MNLERMKFVLTLLCVEVLIIILYVLFVSYDKDADASDPRNSMDPSFGGYDQEKNPIRHFHPCKPSSFFF